MRGFSVTILFGGLFPATVNMLPGINTKHNNQDGIAESYKNSQYDSVRILPAIGDAKYQYYRQPLKYSELAPGCKNEIKTDQQQHCA